MKHQGHVTKGWLLRRLAECPPRSGRAFAYVETLEELTGQTWRFERGRWLATPTPPVARTFEQFSEGA